MDRSADFATDRRLPRAAQGGRHSLCKQPPRRWLVAGRTGRKLGSGSIRPAWVALAQASDLLGNQSQGGRSLPETPFVDPNASERLPSGSSPSDLAPAADGGVSLGGW